jgi:sporulation protein YlmC with PRC-barrel domain
MRLKELRGLPVIDPTAARKIGLIVDYQVDPVSGRVAALDIDTVEPGRSERVLAQRIRRVGKHAVVLTARGGSSRGPEPDLNERWLDTGTLTNLEVMGDDGNRVGRVHDATFNQDTLEIEAYLLRAEGWRALFRLGGRIQPAQVHACSRELMVVISGPLSEAAASSTVDEPTEIAPRMPLKAEDRVPSSPLEDQVPEPEPVAARVS